MNDYHAFESTSGGSNGGNGGGCSGTFLIWVIVLTIMGKLLGL